MVLTFGVLVIVLVILIRSIGVFKSSLKEFTLYKNLSDYLTADWVILD